MLLIDKLVLIPYNKTALSSRLGSLVIYMVTNYQDKFRLCEVGSLNCNFMINYGDDATKTMLERLVFLFVVG